MAKDFLSKGADYLKDIFEGVKKMKQEKLPDKELDKYRGELENLQENISKMKIDQVTTRLKDAFMIDMNELGITSEQEKGIYWEQAFREAYIEINNIKNHSIEVARLPLDQLVKESTHARLKEMIGSKDPEKEGKNVFNEIVKKIPGGKEGLAAGLSLLSFLGIKKDSNLGKFIDWIKEKFGIEDEKKKEKVPVLAPEKIRKMADKAKPLIAEYRKAVPKDDISKRNAFFKSKNIAPYPANRNEKGFSYEGYYASSLLIKEYSIKANTKESRGLEEAIKIAKTELTGAKKAPEKGPKLSPEAITSQFTKAKIEIDEGSIDPDIDYLNKNKGTEKLDIGKRVEKGLAEGSSFMKIADSIKKGLKDNPFKFRLLDIRLDQLSDSQINELDESINNKKNLKPKVVRALLNDLSEPSKFAKVISNFEKLA